MRVCELPHTELALMATVSEDLLRPQNHPSSALHSIAQGLQAFCHSPVSGGQPAVWHSARYWGLRKAKAELLFSILEWTNKKVLNLTAERYTQYSRAGMG